MHCIQAILFPPGETPDRDTIQLPKNWKLGLPNENNPQNGIRIETDYFGGPGEQHAIVYKDGQVVSTNVWNPNADRFNPINKALKFFGLIKDDGVDEFDTINLGHYRSNEDIPLNENSYEALDEDEEEPFTFI